MNRWNLSSFAAGLIALSAPSFAETPIWSAQEAQAAVAAGEILLLDIRRPSEWAETGVAKRALPVSMHDKAFGANLQEILSKFAGKPIAMICATGGRTEYVTGVLAQNGLTGVIDVSEGMFGNNRGSGWLAQNLPIVDKATAEAAYQSLMAQ